MDVLQGTLIKLAKMSLSLLDDMDLCLQSIGVFFLEMATKDNKLWVVAEALDAVFDVFAEDHIDPIVKEIGLIDKLRALAPMLKVKVST